MIGNLGVTVQAATPVGNHPPDPWGSFRFIVQIEGVTAMRFKSCGPIGVDGTADQVKQGGRNGPGDQLPPLSWKWKPVSLQRGMAQDGIALWKWIMDTVSKKRVEPHNITITLLDNEGKAGMTWTFLKAYPTNWSITPFDASSGNLAVETIQFAHQGASVQFAGGSYENTGTPPPAPPTPPEKPNTPAPKSAPAPAKKTQPASGGKPAGGAQDSGHDRPQLVEQQAETAGSGTGEQSSNQFTPTYEKPADQVIGTVGGDGQS